MTKTNKPTATVDLGNIGSEDQARKIRRVLQGETMMNFFVNISSEMGNWPVSVSTYREGTTESELREMVLYTLALKV